MMDFWIISLIWAFESNRFLNVGCYYMVMTNINDSLESAYEIVDEINDEDLQEFAREAVDYTAVFGQTVQQSDSPEKIGQNWRYGVKGFVDTERKKNELFEDSREIMGITRDLNYNPTDDELEEMADTRKMVGVYEEVANVYLKSIEEANNAERRAISNEAGSTDLDLIDTIEAAKSALEQRQ